MAQVRIKNLTQHRIYVPVPVGIMMRPAQEVILSEVSDDLLAQSKKISNLVQRGVVQVSIQPQDPEIDDTLETRFISVGGVPMHATSHYDGGVDPIDISQLRASGGLPGYILVAAGGGSVTWQPHAVPVHASNHAFGGSDVLDVGDLDSSSAPAAGYIPASDGAGSIAWVTPSAPGAHSGTHSAGSSDTIDVKNLGSASAPSADQLARSDGAGGLAWVGPLTTTPTADAIPKADGAGKLAAGWIPAVAPIAHASSHQNGGADEVSTATPAANAIPKADGTGQLAAGWIPVAGSLAVLTKEPTGFPNRTDSVVSFAPSPNRRFTIQPAVTSFDFYINGVQFTKSAAETVDLTATTGLWFIYYDATGTLQASLTPWSFGDDKAFVAIVYWNTAATTQKLWGDERHGLVMDWQTHEYLHRVEHARYISGFGLSGFTLDSDIDADVTFGLGNGQIIDEDILMSIVHAATPTNPFEQVLADPAELPVVYRDGVGGNWLKDTATTFPFKNGATRINYNAESGGTWSQAEVANNDFVAYWIFATNDPDEPIVSLQGQREDNTLAESRANNGFNSLNLGALPSPEWKLLYRVIYQTGNGFAGTRYAKLQSVDDFRTAGVQPGAIASATSHSSLADLAVGNDHPQYQLKPSRTVSVATSGTEAASIADAITLANALTPTAGNPVVILVYPGTYSTPPFTLPDYVSIVGIGGKEAVIIDASTATSALCSANGGQRIEGLTFRDASGVGGVGVAVAGTTGILLIRDCYIDDCETAIRCVGTGYSVEVVHVDVEDGVTGMLVNGIGANARISQLAITDFTTGLHIGSTGGIATGYGLRVVDDAGFTTHVKVENASSVLALVESILRMDKVDFVSGAEIALSVASQTPGDEAIHQVAELHVGTHDRPRESCFGGGDSNTRTLGVLTNTNLEAGTWADITTNLKFQDATSATLLAGVGVGNCCYIGGDFKFPGFKTLTTTAMALGTGSVIMEFWNGSAWTAFRHMTTKGSLPYTQYAQDLLTRVASEHVRFDTDMLATWATKTLNTVTKYWVRLRVVTAITTAPAADIIKNHTHRTEINDDGVVEFFGNAEPHRDLVWHVQLEGRPEVGDAKDAVSDISSTLSWKGRDNEFLGDALYGKVSGIRVAPSWDTSREMIYTFGWHPEDGAGLTGDVEIELAGYLFKPGDQFDGTKTAAFTASEIIDVSTLSNAEAVLTTFPFSIPTMVAGDLLILNVYRDAAVGNGDDTFAGTVIQFLAALEGVVWRT